MKSNNEPVWKKKYEAGCEWCGRKIPGVPERRNSSLKRYGLDFCHIISRRNGPALEWNGFVLCPTWHRLFDEVIKPKIISALETAVSGFPEIPTEPTKQYVSARDYKHAIECMSHKAIRLTDPKKYSKRWKDRKPAP